MNNLWPGGGLFHLGDTVDGITIIHAFRTAPNKPINPATDDLGTLRWLVDGRPAAIDNYGQVVGWSWINADDT